MKLAQAFLLALLLSPAASHAESVYLYAKGKKIPLTVSTKYAALKVTQGEGAGTFTSAAGESAIVQSPVLDQKHIVLVKLPGDPQKRAAVVGSFTSDVGQKIPVYSLKNTDLIAQNEILIGLPTPLERSTAKEELTKQGNVRPLPPLGTANAYLLTVKSATLALEIANKLSSRDDIRFAEPNFIAILPPRPRVEPETPVPAPSSPTKTFPSDPFFPRQWAVHPLSDNRRVDIHALEAWKAQSPLATVTIAILDEGVDTEHPDLADKIVSPYDAISDTTQQKPNAWDGHGTACAGIAAATTDNRKGIAGVAPTAKIMPVRIGSSQKPVHKGDPHPWVTTWEIIARGIRRAVDSGADVLSNSWGGGYSDLVNDAIDYAISNGRAGKGAVVVFAAGNEDSDVDWPANLAANKSVIAVGAINENRELKSMTSHDNENWWGSNHGPEITVVAPGIHIFTTDIRGNGGYSATDYFPNFNGTSSATPFVAGAAALVLAFHSDWTAAQVRERLATTADPISVGSGAGHGEINICKAVGQGC